MFTPDQLPIYTRKVTRLRFPVSRLKTYKILALTENCNLIDIWDNLNILKADIRVFSSPRFTLGGIVHQSDKAAVKEMKSRGMITYAFMKQVTKAKRNCVIDLGPFAEALRNKVRNLFNTPRSSLLFTNGLQTFADDKSFYNVLMYVIDLRKDFQVAMNRKLAWIPLFHYLRQKENIPFVDSMFLCIIGSKGSPLYVKIFDKHEKINYVRTVGFLKAIKASMTSLENFGDEIAEDVNITEIEKETISKTSAKENMLKVTPDKTEKAIRQSVSFVVQKHPEQASDISEILSKKPANDEEKLKQKALQLASLKYKVTGQKKDFDEVMENSKMIAKSLPKNQIMKQVKSYENDIGKYAERANTEYQASNMSTDEIKSKVDIKTVLDNKLPNSIMENRQKSFNTTFFNDLVKILQTFSTKKFPLKLVKYTIETKIDTADVKASKMVSFKFIMKDPEGKEYPNEILLPYIDKNGTMQINGLSKVLIGQLSLKTVYFPEPHLCKLNTYFSTMQIQYRSVRKINYAIGYITGMVIPMYLVFSMVFKGKMEELFTRLGFSKKDLIVTDNTADTKAAKKDNAKWFIEFDNNEYIFFPVKIMESNQYAQTLFYSMKLINYKNRHITSSQFLDDDYLSTLATLTTGRKNAGFLIESFKEGFLDPISLEILEGQGYPLKLDELLWRCFKEVHTNKEDRRTDLNIERYRSVETFLHVLYKQLLMAYRVYETRKLIGYTDSTFSLQPDFVYKEITGSQLVRQNECINPIEEISSAVRVTYVGIGGVANADGVGEKMRNVDETYYGTIDTIDTPEGGGNVGMLQHLTVDADIRDNRGNFNIKKKSNDECNGVNSLNTSLTPFSNHDAGARMIMAANQIRQSVPLVNKQVPLVQTGYETALVSYLSGAFVKKSIYNGVVKSIDDMIIIESDEPKTKGQKQYIDLNPKKLTSGMSVHSISYFDVKVKVGQKVKKYQLIAEGASMKDGTISLGTNLLIAYMPYNGANHDDAMIMNSKSKDSVLSRHIETISLLIPPQTKFIVVPGRTDHGDRFDVVQKLMKNGSGIEYKKGDTIISYVPQNLSQFLEVNPDERVYGGGVVKQKAHTDGKIVDIRIYFNEDIKDYPELNQLLLISSKKHNLNEHGKYSIKGTKIEGMLIEMDFEYDETGINLGDKYANRHGNKGVIGMCNDKMPVTPWGEEIDVISNPLGVIGRMNPGQIFEAYLGLIGWKAKQELMKSPTQKHAIELVKKIWFDNLDGSKNKLISRTYMSVLKSMSKENFERWLDNIKAQRGIPWIYPSYHTPTMTEIQRGLSTLGLKDKYELELPLYGPNIKTKMPVTVGIVYMYKMEHVSSHKLASRSTGSYNSKTMQPTQSYTLKSGQRVGEFDSWTLFSNGAVNILKDMFGPMSDDHVSKNQMINNIIENGYSHSPQKMYSTPTRDLLEVYFRLMMIDFGG